MQLAERWLAWGLIAACACAGLAATAPLLRPKHHSHRLSLERKRCRDNAHVHLSRVAGGDTFQRAGQAGLDGAATGESDSYQRIFDSLRFKLQRCFGSENRVEVLITVAPDGHVAAVSHRPAPSTPASRCAEAEIRHQRFPASTQTLAIRVPLQPPSADQN